MSEHPTDAHFLFTFVFKQALIERIVASGILNHITFRHKMNTHFMSILWH